MFQSSVLDVNTYINIMKGRLINEKTCMFITLLHLFITLHLLFITLYVLFITIPVLINGNIKLLSKYSATPVLINGNILLILYYITFII